MKPIPLLVIGGYLGAGKTTLVNHLLRQAQGHERIAVLVNDFGSVSIDADLIQGASDGVLALAGGCVCCSFGEDLIGTLQRVATREAAPDRVLLECSGVGLPGAVARTAALASNVKVDGIAVVVDAAEVKRQSRDRYVGDTVRAQIEAADLLILNQVDRCGDAGLADVQAHLRELNPAAAQITCERADVPPGLLLGLRPVPRDGAPGWQGSAGRWRKADTAAESRYRFFEQVVDGAVDPAALAQALLAEHQGLLRAKGVVRGLDGRLWTVQLMGRRFSVEPQERDTDATGRLVCIALLG
jgi:G3E family GTPase